MSAFRIALANIHPPASPDESVCMVLEAMEAAAAGSARLVCFPECFMPGYRLGRDVPASDAVWLEKAWAEVDAKAAELGICVVLGTERPVDDGLRISVRVTNPDGTFAGFQDKVQLDPTEEGTYVAGTARRIFHCGELTFGVVICHEGWRYPETVRWAARNGAQVVLHPHFEVVENERPTVAGFADPANTFHEKAALCRAAENTCYFATVNCALPGASTTSAVIDPDGSLLVYQPHGEDGILFGEIDVSRATRLLAKRFRPDGFDDADG